VTWPEGEEVYPPNYERYLLDLEATPAAKRLPYLERVAAEE